ncbi:hypothetical protein QA639_04705 [Bradyrhizobium pachyrhizi]|uniref:hypothetical protein n=1 Tax=Bradyrhizobium pachyrhizi TaxID=280333 RepID=UPI0024B25AE1|nr:hypothetical protein [Bradyrhizobium pachyrhizi]WFU56831.1 hypothetical protein QA639_04705 [Bradyrhizobium pachyrhizi]
MEIQEAWSVVIGANELALALSDVDDDLKIRAGIAGLSIEQIASIVADVASGANVLQELGVAGSYYVKEIRGVKYVILRGHASLRPYLKGTRYLANNPAIVRLGLGPAGASSALRSTFVLALTMYAAAQVAGYLSGDEQTLQDLTAGLLETGAGTVLSIVAAEITSTAVGFVTAAVFPAFALGAVAGTVVSIWYDNWEKETNVTRNLVRTMVVAAQSFFAERERPELEMPEQWDCLPGLSEYFCTPKRGSGRGSGGREEGGGSGRGGDNSDPGDPDEPGNGLGQGEEGEHSDPGGDNGDSGHGQGENGEDGSVEVGISGDDLFVVQTFDPESNSWGPPSAEKHVEIVTGRVGEGHSDGSN